MTGGTDYGKWDKLTSDLVSQTEQEDEADKKAASEELGHTRVPYSASEAEERAKAEMARNAKKALDQQHERESNAIAVLEELLKERESVTVDENMMGSKRVLTLRNCRGPGTILLPTELSNLPHPVRINEEKEVEFANVEGLIKVFIEDCHDCTVFVECKILTSMIELHKCSNITIEVAKERLSTIQADLCKGLTIRYMDERCFGQKEDKIYHAGVSDMKVTIKKKGGSETKMEKTMDYLKDGAVAQLNASPEEYQFVTSIVDGVLLTERLIRIGPKMVTQRELDAEKLKRGEEKDVSASNDAPLEKEESETKLSRDEIFNIIQQCLTHKADGNGAFTSGEYAQAVLFYTLAIDKSAGLNTVAADGTSFSERHICFANRSACFLKLGHHEKALADAESCIDIDPKYIKGLFRKGLALHAMKRYEEAMPVLVKCLEIEPKNKQIKQALQFCEVNFQKEMRKRMGN